MARKISKFRDVAKYLINLYYKIKKFVFIKRAIIKRTESVRAEEARVSDKLERGFKLNVFFIVMEPSLWKCRNLYDKMAVSHEFSPYVVVVPRLNSQDSIALYHETVNYFRSQNCNVLETRSGVKWSDLDSLNIKPDIEFISYPYQCTYEKYTIVGRLNKLTCYVPYFAQVCRNYESHFNGITENLVWANFQISNYHKLICEEHSFVKGTNVVVTGFPPLDGYSSKKNNNVENLAWKGSGRVKIIIALHHSVFNSTLMANSKFIEFSKILENLVEKYSEVVQFSFKPHPLLKDKLIASEEWGESKTNMYWDFWENSKNCQLDVGDYEDLFLGSDALIHDCTSFIAEYAYLNKPCLYLNPKVYDMLNSYGKQGYKSHHVCNETEDIYHFVEKVIRNEIGSKSSEILAPEIDASKNIINYLTSRLGSERTIF